MLISFLEERYVELWGRCKSNLSHFSGGSAFLYVDNADYKWRKPQAPVIPDYCYHVVRETYKEKSDGGKSVTKTKLVRRLDPAQQRSHTECVPVVYPDTFSLQDKTCGGDCSLQDKTCEDDCSQWDINSVCGAQGRCVCREDMMWNSQ